MHESKGDGVQRWEKDESDEKKCSGRGEEEVKRALVRQRWGRSGRTYCRSDLLAVARALYGDNGGVAWFLRLVSRGEEVAIGIRLLKGVVLEARGYLKSKSMREDLSVRTPDIGNAQRDLPQE